MLFAVVESDKRYIRLKDLRAFLTPKYHAVAGKECKAVVVQSCLSKEFFSRK
jgi:hypothetical protein